jgi:hypothetical protein
MDEVRRSRYGASEATMSGTKLRLHSLELIAHLDPLRKRAPSLVADDGAGKSFRFSFLDRGRVRTRSARRLSGLAAPRTAPDRP